MFDRQFKIATSQGPQTTPVSIAGETRTSRSLCRPQVERNPAGARISRETLAIRRSCSSRHANTCGTQLSDRPSPVLVFSEAQDCASRRSVLADVEQVQPPRI